MGKLREYVGTYRVLAEYDKSTNDWVRDEFGELDKSFDDFYIPLENNIGRILQYDNKTFIFHIIDNPDIFLKLKNIQKKNPPKIHGTLGGSSDGFVYIKEEDLQKCFDIVTPETSKKNIDPFDYRNLPKPFKLPKKAEMQYKELAEKIAKEGNFKLANLSRKFIATDMDKFRESGLTYVGFIYQNGKWDDFLNFLVKNS